MTAGDESLDRIHIRDLQVRCLIGIYEDERREKQDVIINVTMEACLRDACRSDSIDDTVDYKRIKKRILAMVEKSACFLVENLAQRVADICLGDERVQRVTVTVDKPGALRFARSVAIEITRDRSSGG